MRLLVTGGAGFMGSNLIRYVLAATEDVEVVNLDALTYAGHLASLIEVEDDRRYRFVRGDVRDAELVARLVSDVDAVVHCAAESHVDRSIEGPHAFLDTNVTGSGVLFEACRREGVKHLLALSSAEVYGPVPAPRSALPEDAVLPSSPNAASRAAADLLARSYGVTYGYPITVTRTTNCYGPYQYPEKLVPLLITNLIDDQPLPVYGDGAHIRDWIHVQDACAAHWRLLTSAEPGGVHHVAAGEERTNRDMAVHLLERFGLGEELIRYVQDRPGHDRRSSLDASVLRGLGWQPTRSLEEGLEETVAWYRANEWWWRPLKASGASQRRGRRLRPRIAS